jgi:hypothetical protein
VGGLLDLWPKFLPNVLSFGGLGLGGLAAPTIRVWSRRPLEQAGGGAGLNRRRAFADQADGSREPEWIVQGGENG